MKQHGKISDTDYKAMYDALNMAQTATYQTYLADREAFISDVSETYAELKDQLEWAITEAAENTSPSIWDHWIGMLAYDSGTGKGSANYAEASHRNAIKGKFQDIQDAINEGVESLQIAPVVIPVEYSIPTADQLPSKINTYTLTRDSVIPQYASGTNSAAAGLALVGENGPELVRFRGGEQVYTAEETRSILGESGGISVHIQQSVSLGSGTTTEMITGMNDDLTDKIKSVLLDILENQRRNAYA